MYNVGLYTHINCINLFTVIFKVGHSALFVYFNLIYSIIIVVLYKQLYFIVHTPVYNVHI